MPFIKSFSFAPGRQQPFPFNIPAVQFAKEIAIDSVVTIFVGDNGSGKSTLLETLALYLGLPLIGGFITERAAGFEAARLLRPCLQLEWKRETKRGFFFRAEDFSDFINSVEKAQNSIEDSLGELRGNVADSIISTMGENMNRALQQMRRDYGENMQAFSHGEAYLKILQTRIADKGIYLLDEPEAALSPIRQLSLIAFILEVLKKKNSQFIIATHSPLLMGIPNAAIYEIQEDKMKRVAWEETDHYRITKTFLDNPQHYLRHLV